VAVGDKEPVPARAERHDGELVLTIGDRTVRYAYAEQSGAPGGGLLWLGRDGHAWAVRTEPRPTARTAETQATDGIVASPMPGTVLAVNVIEGQEVALGQPLLIVEAMKMEHTVTAISWSSPASRSRWTRPSPSSALMDRPADARLAACWLGRLPQRFRAPFNQRRRPSGVGGVPVVF
jgi:hypothetical protein